MLLGQLYPTQVRFPVLKAPHFFLVFYGSLFCLQLLSLPLHLPPLVLPPLPSPTPPHPTPTPRLKKLLGKRLVKNATL